MSKFSMFTNKEYSFLFTTSVSTIAPTGNFFSKTSNGFVWLRRWDIATRLFSLSISVITQSILSPKDHYWGITTDRNELAFILGDFVNHLDSDLVIIHSDSVVIILLLALAIILGNDFAALRSCPTPSRRRMCLGWARAFKRPRTPGFVY